MLVQALIFFKFIKFCKFNHNIYIWIFVCTLCDLCPVVSSVCFLISLILHWLDLFLLLACGCWVEGTRLASLSLSEGPALLLLALLLPNIATALMLHSIGFAMYYCKSYAVQWAVYIGCALAILNYYYNYCGLGCALKESSGIFWISRNPQRKGGDHDEQNIPFIILTYHIQCNLLWNSLHVGWFARQMVVADS